MTSTTGISFMRQLGILHTDNMKDVSVHVVGAGSAGSFTVLTLAKMGIRKIEVWDDDTIESHNIPNQFYMVTQTGKNKVDALKEMVKTMTGVDIKVRNERFTEDSEMDLSTGKNIVVMCTDSKESRRTIWKKIKNTPDCVLVDSRMGAEMMKIYTMRTTDTMVQGDYEDSLKQNGVELPCTARTIIYNVLVLSGIVVSQIKKVINGEDCPFEVILDLKTMVFMTK